jgi:Ca2+-binding EF-hand superfamily protein
MDTKTKDPPPQVVAAPKADWKVHFDRFDANKNGKIDYHEIRSVIKSLYSPTQSEVDNCFEQFDKDKDGKITFAEFLSVLTTIEALKLDNVNTMKHDQKKLPSQQKTAVVNLSDKEKEELKKQFDAIDKDKNNHIDKSESRRLAQDRWVPPPQLVDSVLKYLDTSKDGLVSYEEFAAAMDKCQGDLVTLLKHSAVPVVHIDSDDLARFTKQFNRLDTNNDGCLDMHEVRQLLKSIYVPSDEEVDKTFAGYDKNKDGKITFEEFCDGLMTVEAMQLDQVITIKHAADQKKRNMPSQQKTTKQDVEAKWKQDTVNKDVLLADLRKQFDQIDANKSGFVDKFEARRLAQDRYAPSPASVELVMKHMDFNQDKTISLQEFVAAMQKAQGYLPELVKAALGAQKQEQKEDKKA